LAGKASVYEAATDTSLAAVAGAVMAEMKETLPEETRRDADGYAEELFKRFANPGLRHELRQIAMDGSQKMPVRILAALRERLQRSLPSPALEGALAAWLVFVHAEVLAGRSLDDPLNARFEQLVGAAENREAALQGLLNIEAVFGDLWKNHPQIRGNILKASHAF
jgi:fructuronate reductase